MTVVGPAGIGKSRLALEFSQHVSLARRAGAPRAFDAVRVGARPDSAFGHHVKQLAHVFDSDGREEAQEKLRATLVELVGLGG